MREFLSISVLDGLRNSLNPSKFSMLYRVYQCGNLLNNSVSVPTLWSSGWVTLLAPSYWFRVYLLVFVKSASRISCLNLCWKKIGFWNRCLNGLHEGDMSISMRMEVVWTNPFKYLVLSPEVMALPWGTIFFPRLAIAFPLYGAYFGVNLKDLFWPRFCFRLLILIFWDFSTFFDKTFPSLALAISV